MKLVAISDLHGDIIPLHRLPAGDVLVIAGDVLPDDYGGPHHAGYQGSNRMVRQMWWHDEVFVPWLTKLRESYGHVIFIAGNHDFAYQAIAGVGKLPDGVHYLNESSVVIDDVKFYGAPWNMTQGWAFAIDEKGYAQKLGAMPEDVDILVTHGPPAIKDMPGFHWTSQILADWISLTPYKAVICGHIHEAYGTYAIGEVPVYVASSKDRKYELVNAPMEIAI